MREWYHVGDGDATAAPADGLEGEAAGAAGPVEDVDLIASQGERQAQLLPGDLGRPCDRQRDDAAAGPVIQDRWPPRRVKDQKEFVRRRRRQQRRNQVAQVRRDAGRSFGQRPDVDGDAQRARRRRNPQRPLSRASTPNVFTTITASRKTDWCFT